MASATGASRGGMPSASDMNIDDVMSMAQANAMATGTAPSLMRKSGL